jgi:hypothetical protein
MAIFLFFLLTVVVPVVAAQRLAVSRGRRARAWMMAAALLGPLPLIPLALLPGR